MSFYTDVQPIAEDVVCRKVETELKHASFGAREANAAPKVTEEETKEEDKKDIDEGLDVSEGSGLTEDSIEPAKDTEKCDWSEELCELIPDANSTISDVNNVRDSAYHSPTENMSASPQLSSYSDQHSEGSSDSGKGSFPPCSVATVVYEFALAQKWIGRLIGRNGAFVNLINSQTHANITVKHHPEVNKFKLCSIEGSQMEVDAALSMIRLKFPENQFPAVTLERVIVSPLSSTMKLVSDSVALQLVEGVNNDCRSSCVISGGELSLHQPLHPTFPQLDLLQQCMAATYAMPDSPSLPSSVSPGMVCVCPFDGQWYRAQVTSVVTPEEVLVRLVDFGDRMYVSISELRQIRKDFMTLPFQAVDCLLAKIKPVGGAVEWPVDVGECLYSLTNNSPLMQAQIYGFLDDVPLILLYCSIGVNQVMFINEELVARGMAEWIEAEA